MYCSTSNYTLYSKNIGRVGRNSYFTQRLSNRNCVSGNAKERTRWGERSSRTSSPDSSHLIVACQALRQTEINMLGPPVTQCCKRCDRRIPAYPGVHRSTRMRYDDIVTLPVSWRSRKFTLSIVDDVSEPAGWSAGWPQRYFRPLIWMHTPVLYARWSLESRCTSYEFGLGTQMILPHRYIVQHTRRFET